MPRHTVGQYASTSGLRMAWALALLCLPSVDASAHATCGGDYVCIADGSNSVNGSAARPAAERWALDDWTVVTIARDGSWGMGISASQNRAIAAAVRDCKAMASAPNDCGALFTTTRGGWIVANLCGDQKIIATAATREEAEQEALHREIDLELFYVPHLPPWKRLVTIAPQAIIVASDLAYSGRW